MREKLNIIKSRCVPLPLDNIDTDQIIPARFLKTTTRDGFGTNLFRDWRYGKDGTPNPDFVLNDARYSGKILVAGRNFGCGSSREHAAWAIYDYGFRVVVSTFFADIFRGNALNNGLLPLVVSPGFFEKLTAAATRDPSATVTVDLPAQTITIDGTGKSEHFEINAYKKECLMSGHDDIGYLLANRDKIEEYEKENLKINKKNMKIKLAVLPGDGIGPEIVEQAMKCVEAVCAKFGHELSARYAPVGAAAIDETGSPYPGQTHTICMESDAVLFGAIGSPKYDNDPQAKVRPEQGLLAMRKALGLYANIRPVKVFPSLAEKSPLKRELIENADLVCIRELTGGIYFGEKGESEDGRQAFDICTYTREEIERIVRLAFGYARDRRRKLTMVDKANVLATSRLWRRVTQEIAAEFSDVETEYMFVDNAAMRLVQWPASFDVIVTENMFGDILTDEASVITGSLGMLPSASVGIHTSVFEPIHGSFPQAAGKNIANPVATILSAAMMFEYAFGLTTESEAIKAVVDAALEADIVTEDIAPKGRKADATSAVGDWIANRIMK